MPDTLHSWASTRGYRVAWGPASVVEEAKAGITALADSGALDATFFRSELGGEMVPQKHRPDRSVVMIAVPRPAHRVSFDLTEVGGGTLEAILPPTYLRYRSLFEEVRQDLALNGLPVEHLHGPHKAIAARLGLVKYGRNNLTYTPRIGSYLQLCGYVTDAVLPSAPAAQEPELLPECRDCLRCRKACPTRAIGEDRVLLRAQRCLTHANESPGA